MTEQEQLDDLKNTLKLLNAKARALQGTIAATEKVLAADNESLKKLVGAYRETGEIACNRGQVEDLERKIEDRKKPRVIWEEDREGDYIVDKVTPKRIAVKEVGHTRSEQFNRDGTPVSQYSFRRHVIDLQATFGDDYSVDD